MNIKRLLVAAAVFVLTPAAIATPHYIGPTDADYAGDAPNFAPLAANGSGYYIWSNGALDDWWIVWSAQIAPGSTEQFFGSVVISGTGLDSYTEIAFEAGDGSVDGVISGVGDDSFGLDGPIHFVSWESGNNTAWDGINFILDDPLSEGELLTFELFSTKLDQSAWVKGDEQEGEEIYIGQDFNLTDVEIIEAGSDYDQNFPDILGQRFEIKVPEPSTAALVGIGLIGLGFARRRRS